MQCANWQLWELPFFGPEHRKLEKELHEWRSAFPSLATKLNSMPLDEQCRYLALALGASNLLEYVIPGTVDPVKIDVRAVCMIREALAYDCALADFVFAMQGIGSAAIWLFGSQRLKETYLPQIRKGEALAGFAMSEPEGGSDVSALATAATQNGKDYLINGVKAWISNGGIANHYIVIARSEAAPGAKGLSAFLVDADAPGITIESRSTIISPHPIATIRLTDCRVPRTHLLGGRGEGFKAAMATLEIFRASVGAAAIGLARRALDETVVRMTSRHIFGKRMSEMDTIRMKLADMKLDLDCAALLVYRAAWLKDVKSRSIVSEAALAKLGATEAAQRVVDSAVQLFGGAGVTQGSVVEKLYRDVRPMRIYEGASEIQKLIIGKNLLDRRSHIARAI